MAHRPLHIWQLDEQGRPKLDRHGERIPHRKQGQAKSDRELTPAERETVDWQNKLYNDNRRWAAERRLTQLDEDRKLLGRT